MLTIAIPTYNRNERLARSLEILVPQLSAGVKLVIIDNCSSVPIKDTVEPYLLSNVKVVRNTYNIGMAANILRCFENCDTEWLWVLGDDDPPHKNAVEIIIQEIKAHP
ncbi:MAG: glycosyltransferase family 2 protein, partial [Hymenobacter sp.]